MGIFTWTFADKPERKAKLYDEYLRSCVLQYGGTGVVVTPNNHKIVERNYNGYGIFDGHDIYEMVVDWNKAHLNEIFVGVKERNPNYPFDLDAIEKVAVAFQNDDPEMQKIIDEVADKHPYLWKDWKRTIGIAISCYDEDNDALPFPIKIASRVDCKTYNNLHPSHETQ